MTIVSSLGDMNLCTGQKDGRSDALSEVMLHSEQGLGFICLTAAVLNTAWVEYKENGDSGNALHASCLLVGHWLS